MIHVCTGWSPSGKIQYGDRFAASFAKYWPKEITLSVYTEETQALPVGVNRLLWDIRGAREFMERHKDNPARAGRERLDGQRWKPAEIAKGYAFRWDSFKFFRQILIPGDAVRWLDDGDILIWLDGDVETIAPVDPAMILAMLAKHDIAYLNRARGHSEIGFWAIRISPKAREFLSLIADCYTSDIFLELPEHHSAFVWDYVRRGMVFAENHLVPPGRTGHVWPMSALGKVTRHDKGGRKGK